MVARISGHANPESSGIASDKDVGDVLCGETWEREAMATGNALTVLWGGLIGLLLIRLGLCVAAVVLVVLHLKSQPSTALTASAASLSMAMLVLGSMTQRYYRFIYKGTIQELRSLKSKR